MTTMGKRFVTRRPAGFRIGLQDELACPHRDISCCKKCEDKYDNIIESYGHHYWLDTKEELAEWNEMITTARADADVLFD